MMLKGPKMTFIAAAIAATFQVSHATESQTTAPSQTTPTTETSRTGEFLTLPLASYNAQTLTVTAEGHTVTLNREDSYKGAVVYSGQIPSLTRASGDNDDLIVILRPDNRLMAIYPDRHQLIYGATSGHQTRLTFTRPLFDKTDHQAPPVQEMAQQLLTRDGATHYQADRDPQGNIVIDLLAGFSASAAKKIVDHEAFALAQVMTINQALKNSKIEKVRVRLVGTQVISRDHSITTTTLSNLSSLFQAGIKEYSPDLIAGFFEGNDDDTAVGWGYVNGRYTVNALYSSTALRHEVGHNAGGGHCSDDGSGDAHGWDNGKTKTIQCGNDIGYYSTPDLQDNYGLAIGKKGEANMARVWRANAEKMSAWSPAVIPFEDENAHLIRQKSVSLGASNGFLQHIELDIPRNTRRLVVSAVPGPQHEESSKFSLYLSEGSWPSPDNYDFASREHWNTFLGVATPASGKWYLAVASKNKAINDIVINVQAFTTADDEHPEEEWPTAIQNPGAETGNLKGWHLEKGQFRVVTEQDGIAPYQGKYFLTARIDDSAANNADRDRMSQTITLDSREVSKGKTTAKLRFMSNGWGDGDYGIVTLIAKDANGRQLKTAQTQTRSEKNRWLHNDVSLALPADAARLELQLQAIKKAGYTSDVHFDDFALTLEQDQPPQNNDQAFINAAALTVNSIASAESVTFNGQVSSSAAATSVPAYTWTLPPLAQGGNSGQALQRFTVNKTHQEQSLKVKVRVTAGQASRELEQNITVPALAGDNHYPDWVYGTQYRVGDVVQHKGKNFECKVAGWCSQTGEWSQLHYEPGIGLNWTQAWKAR